VDVAGLIARAKQYAGDNSTTILTAMGVTGTVSTAVLTGKASFKAARVIDKKKEDRGPHMETVEPMTRKEKVKLVWPLYIPAIISGSTTITCIVVGHQVASKKVLALTMASNLSERAFQEYKEKVIEKLGENKDVTIRDSVAQDRVNANPVNTREVILAGTGEVLCFDQMSGRYFQSSVEEIKKAENKTNFEILTHMYASLSFFYEEVGLPPTGFSDEVGFNTDHRCEVSFSTVMSSDDRPCIAIDFHFGPIPDYNRFH
jgi:hypothetical protein